MKDQQYKPWRQTKKTSLKNIKTEIRAYLNGSCPHLYSRLCYLQDILNKACIADAVNAEDYLELTEELTSAILKVLASKLKEV